MKKINGAEVVLEETVFGIEFEDGGGDTLVMECESEEQARFYATFIETARVVVSYVYASTWAPLTKASS